jgi:hypothetical protein
MYEDKHVQINIYPVDAPKCVELDVDGFPFTSDLDERGFPVFTKSQKQQLPPYMPDFVEKMMSKMRTDGVHSAVIYLDVEHEDSCDQFTIIKGCNCNPVVRYHKIGEYYFGRHGAEFTCSICDESSIGQIEDYWGFENTPVWLDAGGRFMAYWRLDPDSRLICDDCMRKYRFRFLLSSSHSDERW